MAKLGTKEKPAIVKVQTEERAMQIMTLCNIRGWEVVVGIEPDSEENISDVNKLYKGNTGSLKPKAAPSRNAPCPCGSGKLYKRCCGA